MLAYSVDHALPLLQSAPLLHPPSLRRRLTQHIVTLILLAIVAFVDQTPFSAAASAFALGQRGGQLDLPLAQLRLPGSNDDWFARVHKVRVRTQRFVIVSVAPRSDFISVMRVERA